jgi:hypothetical protein
LVYNGISEYHMLCFSPNLYSKSKIGGHVCLSEGLAR